MARYYVTTTSARHEAYDEEGIDVPNLNALSLFLRRTLTRIAYEECHYGSNFYSAHAVDVAGKVAARASLTIEFGAG